MIIGKCPICSKPYVICAPDDLPTFPFCSERCRLIDLGRWAGGRYHIPGPLIQEQPDDEVGKSASDEDE